MLIAALTAGAISISPQVHPVCDATGYRLLTAVGQGQITNDQAAMEFRACQIQHPPLAPL